MGSWTIGLTFIVWMWGVAPTAGADPPAPSVEVVPSQLELFETASSFVSVAFRNPSSDQLTDVQLTWFTDVAADVAVDPATPRSALPNSALTWKLTLKRKPEGHRTGRIQLKVDYSWPAPATDGSGLRTNTPRVVFGTLDVVGPGTPQLTIDIRTAPGSVSQETSSRVFVVVKNASDRQVTLRTVAAHGPAFVRIAPVDPSVSGEAMRADAPKVTIGQTIAPGASREVGFDVRASDRIPPGKQLLNFDVTVAIDETEWSFAQFQEVDLAVFGESEFSGLLGVPAFLVLPGVLMVGTWNVLEGWSVPARAAADAAAPATPLPRTGWLDLTSWRGAPPLAILTVGLSVLMAFVIYPLVTGLAARFGWTAGARDYLQGYGTIDLAWVWASAVALAVIAYVAWQAMQAAWRWYYAFSEEDDPRTLIRKMIRRRWPAGRPYVPQVGINVGTSQSAMLLERDHQKPGLYWVAPAILYSLNEGDAAGRLLDRIYAQVDGLGTLKSLERLIDEGVAGNLLTLDYAPSALKGPRRCNVDNPNAPEELFMRRKEP